MKTKKKRFPTLHIVHRHGIWWFSFVAGNGVQLVSSGRYPTLRRALKVWEQLEANLLYRVVLNVEFQPDADRIIKSAIKLLNSRFYYGVKVVR